MLPTLTHVAFHVEDMPGCIAFYEKYCQLKVVHERPSTHQSVVWMSEQNREHEFVLVLIGGGPHHVQSAKDFSHLGFAVDSKAEVDRIAAMAEEDGILEWQPVDQSYPVGYYCGVKDPNGSFVEFSYGQPLGPGSEGKTF